MHRIVICSTCEADGSAAFAERLHSALADAEPACEIRSHACMSCCARPLAMAFAAPGKATYLFGGIDPAIDFADTLAFARLYLQSSDGWVEDARPAGRLRHCLTGRVPA